MRFLALADLHGRNTQLKDLISKAIPFDALLLAGDITNFGPPSSVIEIFDMVDCPIYAVAGNCDPPEVVSVLDRNHINVDGRVEKLGGFTLVGLGGSNPTPYDTPLEYTEDQLLQKMVDTTMGINRPSLLLSHVPPMGILDRTRFNTNGGSTVVRDFMSLFDLVVCGHIHESPGIHKGPPMVVNCGPAKNGYAVIIDFKDGEFQLKPVKAYPDRSPPA